MPHSLAPTSISSSDSPAPSGATPPALGTRRQRFGQIRRLGTPRHWSADLYIRLIEGRWWRVIGTLCLGWLLSNVVFALLYLAGGDCIRGARPGHFADAFNFSVQTLSTMGFGGMVPITPWANTIVGMEALVSLLETALATGLIFAKFSRPRANALFSNIAVITRWEGQRALMFRVANRRGNDVVEASMRVSVLRQQLTAEGHEMHRLYDLPLLRERSPVFTLSWTAIHIIDEQSPLWQIDSQAFVDGEMVLVASLTGFDGTYMQTIHARHTYYSDELRWNQRLQDVISRGDDGAMVLDFTHFHDTLDEPVD